MNQLCKKFPAMSSRKLNTLLLTLLFVFSFSGLNAQTRTELELKDLQKPILEYINQHFKGYTVNRVFKEDAKGVITYDICVNKGQVHEKIFFDKDGKFLRREECSLECCQGTRKK